MLIEDILNEIEKTINDIKKEKLINLWNKIYPEEQMEKNQPLTMDIIDELRSIIIDEANDLDAASVIEIRNYITTDEKISIEDLSNGFEETEEEPFEE
jgi:hypothetical protein